MQAQAKENDFYEFISLKQFFFSEEAALALFTLSYPHFFSVCLVY